MNQNIVNVLLSLLIGIYVIWLTTSIAKYVLAPLVSILVFTLLNYLTKKQALYVSSNHLDRFINSNKSSLLFILCSIISLSLFVLVPANNSSIFSDWLSITSFSWMRLIAAIFLTCFFPGYIILSIVDRHQSLTKIERFAFSYFLSVFLISLLNYGILLLGYSGSNTELVIYFLFFVVFLITYLPYSRLMSRTKLNIDSFTRHTIYPYLILICVSLIFVVLAYSISIPSTSTTYPMLKGDPWRLNGLSDMLNNGQFPGLVQGHVDPYYAWWYPLYLAAFYFVSGVPSVNAYVSLSFLVSISVLMLYSMFSYFLKNIEPKAPAVITVLSLFGGFGWIYAVYLRSTSGSGGSNIFNILYSASYKTYDIIRPINFVPNSLVPLYVIGIPIFLALLYLPWNSRLSNRTRCLLIFVLVSLGYLTHVVEIGLFAIILFAQTLFINRSKFSQFRITTLSSILGLLLVAAIDFTAPAKYYTIEINSNPMGNLLVPSTTFFLSVLLFVLSYFILLIRGRSSLFSSLGKKIQSNLARPKVLMVLILTLVVIFVYLFFLSFIVWGITVNQNSLSLSQVWDTGAVPWFFYPMKLGVIGILAVVGGVILVSKKEAPRLKVFSLFILQASVMLCIILIDRFISFYYEDLLLVYFFITLLPIAALSIITLFTKTEKYQNELNRRLRPRLKAIAGIGLILLILVSGLSSTLLFSDIYSLSGDGWWQGNVVPEEMAALNYLRANTSSSVVATVTSESQERLFDFANKWEAMQTLGPYQDAADVLFGTASPEVVYNTLASFNVSYIFIATRDAQAISSTPEYSDGFFASHLLEHLPIVFNNSAVTIYRVPKFSPPSDNSDCAVVVPASAEAANTELTYYYPVDMFATANRNYTVLVDNDPSRFSFSTLLLTYDSVNVSEYVSWVEGGRNLIVMNSPMASGFKNFLGITDGSSTFANGVDGAEIPTGYFPVNITYAENAKNASISYYTFSGQDVTPFSYTVKLGNGTLSFWETSPILSAVQGMQGDSFVWVDSLAKAIDTYFPASTFIADYPYFDHASTETNATGTVTLTSDSFVFPAQQTLQAGILDLSNATFSISGINSTKTIFANVLIDDLNTFDSTFFLETPFITATPVGIGPYSGFSVQSGFNFSILIDKTGKTSLDFTTNNSTYHLDVRQGTIRFDNVTLIQKPNVIINSEELAGTPSDNVVSIDKINYQLGYDTEANFFMDAWVTIKAPISNMTEPFFALRIAPESMSGPRYYYYFYPTMSQGETIQLGFRYDFDNGTVVPLNDTEPTTFTFDEPNSVPVQDFLGMPNINFLLEIWYPNGLELKQTTTQFNVSIPVVENDTSIFMARSPSLSVDGKLFLGQAFISYPYTPRCYGNSLLAEGSTNFTIPYSDSGIIQLSSISSSAAVEVLQEPVVQWSDNSIPWDTVLLSPLNILLVTCLVNSVFLSLVIMHKIKFRFKRRFKR